ncbi:glycolate oxidase [Methylacidiphilum kamchatkense Kam1]|uniref:Glycolate oxidase n=1 Tax=Methylacidiphilum kamchatkense Kam1 TaxID=1202785 RepID=A0A0C1V548_9BACT|nr:FAD-linked oxidase C-terminal domain-containing protein [Methylacidiphilum kamchatkense]KIE58825.1 glycolate oxidase [Methylacidiphilum kamchatkense Kam1]QDQ41759.1 glycolate oxidase [Methylacidiphilum kamchatkense Kam1]
MELWTEELHRLFPEKFSTSEEQLSKYATDAWLVSRAPDGVFFPESKEDVVALMQFAFSRGIYVTARGGGRGYVGGAVPVKGGVVVSFEKMNRIKEIHPIDGVAVVEPGVITGVLQEKVKAMGLFYPPDPASVMECTIGGNVATNAGGPRCLKYGVTRNYILGLEVVLSDGSVAKVGGRTIKNKTGFDLTSLFVGSEGMLGLVTEITLKLLSFPPLKACLSAYFERMDQAILCVNKILSSGVLPAALEIADRFTLQCAREFTKGEIPPFDAHILLETDGSIGAVHSDIEFFEKIIREFQPKELTRAVGEDACEKLWQSRRLFSMSLKASGLTKLNEDVTVPRSRLADLISLGEYLQSHYGLIVACFGHAGDGNIHVNLMVDWSKKENREKAQEALNVLFDSVILWNGSITGEHGIGIAKLPWWNKAVSQQTRLLHEKIKKALDPKGILNPGKFV